MTLPLQTNYLTGSAVALKLIFSVGIPSSLPVMPTLTILRPILRLDDSAVKITNFPILVKLDGEIMLCVRLHMMRMLH